MRRVVEYVVVGPSYDYDYHPHEADCRLFVTAPEGVLRFDDDVLVTEVRWDKDRILRHYAFADRWIKVNVSRSNNGTILDFNCDIATPMVRDGDAVYAVDLFLDVLIDATATRYQVKDEDELAAAAAAGMVSTSEAKWARAEMSRLVDDVVNGQLLAWLASVFPLDPPDAAPPSDMRRVRVPGRLTAPVRGIGARRSPG